MLTHLLQTVRAVLGDQLGARGVITLLIRLAIGWGVKALAAILTGWCA